MLGTALLAFPPVSRPGSRVTRFRRVCVAMLSDAAPSNSAFHDLSPQEFEYVSTHSAEVVRSHIVEYTHDSATQAAQPPLLLSSLFEYLSEDADTAFLELSTQHTVTVMTTAGASLRLKHGATVCSLHTAEALL